MMIGEIKGTFCCWDQKYFLNSYNTFETCYDLINKNYNMIIDYNLQATLITSQGHEFDTNLPFFIQFLNFKPPSLSII